MTRQPSGGSPPPIRLEGVTRVLPGPVPVTLVEAVDLTIDHGEFVAITGPSGSGKSSLLYLLGLLDRPTKGQIYLDGEATAEMSETTRARLRLAKLGFVFQFHFLLPEFDVSRNVALPIEKLGDLNSVESARRVEQLLESLDLADCARKMPDHLSGGQRQRVAIARALANDPSVVLADEPTGNLDTKNGARVFDIFEELVTQGGRSVVTVTHDPQLAARTQRRVHIVDGRITDGVNKEPAVD